MGKTIPSAPPRMLYDVKLPPRYSTAPEAAANGAAKDSALVGNNTLEDHRSTSSTRSRRSHAAVAGADERAGDAAHPFEVPASVGRWSPCRQSRRSRHADHPARERATLPRATSPTAWWWTSPRARSLCASTRQPRLVARVARLPAPARPRCCAPRPSPRRRASPPRRARHAERGRRGAPAQLLPRARARSAPGTRRSAPGRARTTFKPVAEARVSRSQSSRTASSFFRPRGHSRSTRTRAPSPGSRGIVDASIRSMSRSPFDRVACTARGRGEGTSSAAPGPLVVEPAGTRGVGPPSTCGSPCHYPRGGSDVPFSPAKILGVLNAW